MSMSWDESGSTMSNADQANASQKCLMAAKRGARENLNTRERENTAAYTIMYGGRQLADRTGVNMEQTGLYEHGMRVFPRMFRAQSTLRG
jgi:hypothetical protein